MSFERSWISVFWQKLSKTFAQIFRWTRRPSQSLPKEFHMTIDPEKYQTTSFRPFILEAIYKWHLSNELDPLHLLIDCSEPAPGLQIPPEAMESMSPEKELLLDITPDAVDDLQFGSFIKFTCYFADGPVVIQIPVSCILALFCPLLPACGLFFSETLQLEEENQMEIQILRKEELKYLQIESASQLKERTPKDNLLSRSKLKIVRQSQKETEISKN
jgi:stringent starvation protein B